jgi:hypothetical protein
MSGTTFYRLHFLVLLWVASLIIKSLQIPTFEAELSYELAAGLVACAAMLYHRVLTRDIYATPLTPKSIPGSNRFKKVRK